jgi:hypothetical protein
MGKFDVYKKITFNNKVYTIFKLKYSEQDVPIIIDDMYRDQILRLDKSWHVNEKGHVTTQHRVADTDEMKEFYLHEIIMRLVDPTNDVVKPIIHINRLGVDNRRENLHYDDANKFVTKNLKKKDRTIVLPKLSHVKASDIPSFTWYVKEDDTHGERFMVRLGEIGWKSSSSKLLSLKYKFEETKKWLRELKISQPELFIQHSMNGDMNGRGQILLKEFYGVAEKAGFKNFQKFYGSENTDKYIREDLSGLTDEEVLALREYVPVIRE